MQHFKTGRLNQIKKFFKFEQERVIKSPEHYI